MLLVAEVNAAMFEFPLRFDELLRLEFIIWRCLSTAAVIWSKLAALLLLLLLLFPLLLVFELFD